MDCEVLVIGGGVTGGGVAWDLALRGVRVILAEMGDLATGTSGRYHGLLHSGGRYAVRDGESAKECIDENLIMRKIAPEAVEDTGGYFVLCPGDDASYVDKWLKGCADAGIPTREVSLGEALKRERILNPRLEAVYEVPDGSCDSWDLLHGLQAGAQATGKAQFLTYYRLETLHKQENRIVGARLLNLRSGEPVDVTCAVVVNAAGPWAAQIGALAGARFGMRLSRGAMLAFNIRWVNTVVNKLRAPGDGDIFVPVGTVSVIGTTSVNTDDPGDVRVERWEVERILDEAEGMTPGISRARILRSWGGVRPLYDPGGDGRGAKRTFTVLNHGETDGVQGLVSILGGKLTTYRLMAEKTSDVVCSLLGVTARCTTATTVLPSAHAPTHSVSHLHQLRDRLDSLEHGDNPGALICECEIVTDRQIRAALATGEVNTLHDLRRDLRLGMGPCQGGFCTYRAASIRHEVTQDSPAHTLELLEEFAERRFLGMKPLLWGQNLRQVLLAEHLYGRVMGLFGAESPQIVPDFSNAHFPKLNDGQRPRIVVVGAGLAGLTAALICAEAGAKVELLAQGQGALTLHPGWIEIGDISVQSESAEHPYCWSAGALPVGLAILDRVLPLESSAEPGKPILAITASGVVRTVAFTLGAQYPLIQDRRLLIVGFEGWRDFYPRLCADNLRAAGYDAAAETVALKIRGGNFDTWTTDAATYFDTVEGLAALVAAVKPKRGQADIIGFPAVLGFKPETRQKLSEALGCPIFEIPTLTPSVPGLRLYHALRRTLLAKGGRVTIGTKVEGIASNNGRVMGVYAETAAHQRARLVTADAVILATGGLYGGGLESDYKGSIRESVGDLHVAHVPPLSEWFDEPLMSSAPKSIHRAGLLTDNAGRPLNAEGAVVAENLFAAGRLLAGYSPISEGSTEGVDIATGTQAAMHALAAAPSFVSS